MTDHDMSVLVDGQIKWGCYGRHRPGKPPRAAPWSVFLDEYRGKQVPEGKKSVTLR